VNSRKKTVRHAEWYGEPVLKKAGVSGEKLRGRERATEPSERERSRLASRMSERT